MSEAPLAQLDVVRQPAVMRSVFAQAMRCADICDCAVLNVRYKPGKSCLVSYRLTMAHAASQILCARFYPAGGSLSRFLKAQRRPLAQPAFGNPVFHIPDLDAVVWVFPNDRKLPGVPALIDEQRIHREVAPLLASRALGKVVAVRRSRVDVVRYIPEHGCTVRLTVDHDGANGRSVFYGKTYSDDAGNETYRNMMALSNERQTSRKILQLARPLAYEPDHLTLWQSEVEGPTLASLEAAGSQFVNLLEMAGKAVAELHSRRLPGLKFQSADDLRSALQEAEVRLQRVQPLASRVSSLTRELLQRSYETYADRRVATLHGDLHAKNFVFTGGGAALIDLDNLRAGDPLHDLGSFIASTCARALSHEISESDIAPMIAGVVRGYEASACREVSRPDLRWHTAAALVAQQADRTLVRMKIGSLDALLELAQQSLAGAVMKVLS